MFDFLFKRSSNKAAVVQAQAQAAAAGHAAVQAGARRAEQTARAQAVAGDEAAAVDFILQSEFADARLCAAEHVHSKAMLEKVHQAMRNTDRRVAKLMQGRLDLLRHAQAELQKAQACADTARRLLGDEKLSPNQVAELDRQWQLVEADARQAVPYAPARAALAQRLEAQVALQRAVLDGLAALRALPAGGLDAVAFGQALHALSAAQAERATAAERASLPKQLLNDYAEAEAQAGTALRELDLYQAACEARLLALDGWRGQDPASLDGAQLRQAWQALGRLPENALAASLQEQFDAILAAIPAPPEAEARPARPARAERAAAIPSDELEQQFRAALDGMEAALQQGLLQLASEHDKTLRESKGLRPTPAQADRLAAVRAEFKRLADWARWGGNVSREELVKATEELPAQELPMAELAKKVGSLRERWKSLDTLSGSAPKVLWERFDAACGVAYAPAAAHFRQLAEERQANAARAGELIAEADALAAEGDSDWKRLAATCQRLRQGWSRLGTIDRKEKKRLDSAFGAALAVLAAPLERQRDIETARREQLITEVGLLKPSERNTVDMLRALQEKWQELAKALPLERRAEQELWQRFRAACDDIFAQRKESASAADHERRQHLQVREALCAGLEAAVIDADDERGAAAAIGALLSEARSAWQAAGPVPRAAEAAIEQRYQAAVAAVQAQADAVARRADAALANAVRDKLRLCQALEQALADETDATAGGADWQARWQTLPALAAQYERGLFGRFDAALQALDGARADYAARLEANRAGLLEEVLRLEIVAGVDSGAEFARERLKMQVGVLQSSLKSGQKPVSQAAQLLQLCAMPALADSRTASRIELLLRRIGGDREA